MHIHTHAHTTWRTWSVLFSRIKKKQTNKQTKKHQQIWHPSKNELSHKSRTRGHPAQQHPGEQAVITKLLAVLSHWAPLCVTVGNLFILVFITSQVWQPVNPTNETWFKSTSGTFGKTQTPLGQTMHGQLIPKCACCCCPTVCVSNTNSHQLINTYSELLRWNIPH